MCWRVHIDPLCWKFPVRCFLPKQPLPTRGPLLTHLTVSWKQFKKKMHGGWKKVEGDHRTLKHSSSKAVWPIVQFFSRMYAEGDLILLFFGLAMSCVCPHLLCFGSPKQLKYNIFLARNLAWLRWLLLKFTNHQLKLLPPMFSLLRKSNIS